MESVRELHTSLFKKVHTAYLTLLKDNGIDHVGLDEAEAVAKALPETWGPFTPAMSLSRRRCVRSVRRR